MWTKWQSCLCKYAMARILAHNRVILFHIVIYQSSPWNIVRRNDHRSRLPKKPNKKIIVKILLHEKILPFVTQLLFSEFLIQFIVFNFFYSCNSKLRVYAVCCSYFWVARMNTSFHHTILQVESEEQKKRRNYNILSWNERWNSSIIWIRDGVATSDEPLYKIQVSLNYLYSN